MLRANGPSPIFGLRGERDGRAHVDARHALDAARDHEILGARHHRLRGEVQRLLRRSALAVDRHRRHAVGQRRGEHDVAAEREGLLADLADAADDDVVDRRRIDPGLGDDRVEHRRAEIGGVDAGETAIAAAAGGAAGRDDIGFGCHAYVLG